MNGFVRRQAGARTWSVGLRRPAQRQRCEACGFKRWTEGKPSDACPTCGSLQLVTEERDRDTWTSGYKTKRDATQALREALSKKDQGLFVEPTKVTVGEFIEDVWLPSIERSDDIRPSTLSLYRTLCRAHILPAIGHVALQSLSSEQVDEFYASLRKPPRELSPKSIKNVANLVHGILRHAMKKKRITHNVADLCDDLASEAPSVPQPWDSKQLRKFLEHAQSDRSAGRGHWRVRAG